MNGICILKGKELHYYLPFFLNLLRLYYNLSLKPPHIPIVLWSAHLHNEEHACRLSLKQMKKKVRDQRKVQAPKSHLFYYKRLSFYK